MLDAVFWVCRSLMCLRPDAETSIYHPETLDVKLEAMTCWDIQASPLG